MAVASHSQCKYSPGVSRAIAILGSRLEQFRFLKATHNPSLQPPCDGLPPSHPVGLNRQATQVSPSRIGLVPLGPDGERLVAHLERRSLIEFRWTQRQPLRHPSDCRARHRFGLDLRTARGSMPGRCDGRGQQDRDLTDRAAQGRLAR